jgi:hypothetical protein
LIVFDLQCTDGHLFEGWFEDSRSYKDQLKNGMISCPVCSDTRVGKVPSTFAIRSSQSVSPQPPPEERPDPSKLVEVTKKIADYVEKNFDYVGADFSREALKIHYGIAEPRCIRGVSTKEEEKTLEAEGVAFFKLPIPVPKDTEV